MGLLKGERMTKGIDISNWQADLHDYEALKKDGTEFAILKLSEGTGFTDKSFEKHYEGCKGAGIPVGAYIYSHAQSIEGVKAELDFALKLLRGRRPELGIFLDMEAEDMNTGWNRSVLPIALAFGEYAAHNGLRWGIYANSSWWLYKLDAQAIKDAGGIVWAAEYNRSCRIENADIWQYTNDGRAGAYDRALDMDIMFSPLLTGPKENEESDERDLTVLIMQTLLIQKGAELEADGKSSAAFVKALKEYAGSMEKI